MDELLAAVHCQPRTIVHRGDPLFPKEVKPAQILSVGPLTRRYQRAMVNLVCFVDQDGGLRIHSRDAVGELLDLGLEAASAAGLQISRDDQVVVLRDEAYHTVIESTVAEHVATAHEPPVHARLHHRGHSLPREFPEAARGWHL